MRFWDVDAAIREAALLAHGIVTYDQLRTFGATPSLIKRRCQSGTLVRLQPGVYLVTALLDDYSHLAAGCLSRTGTFSSHRAAAWLLGLDGVDSELVEVSVPYGRGPRGAVVHRTADLEPHDLTIVKGIPCTNATRTLCDIGAMVDIDMVEVMAESALRLGLTRVPRLEWRARQLARKGRSGPDVLLKMLARRPEGAAPTGSFLETKFIQCMRAHGVQQPERQFAVRDASGRLLALLDGAYPNARFWVELDGKGSHGPTQFERDRSRQNDIVLLGWRPLRFTYKHVIHEPDWTAGQVRKALARFS